MTVERWVRKPPYTYRENERINVGAFTGTPIYDAAEAIVAVVQDATNAHGFCAAINRYCIDHPVKPLKPEAKKVVPPQVKLKRGMDTAAQISAEHVARGIKRMVERGSLRRKIKPKGGK